jgi:acyl-CoA thioesterase
VLSAEDPALARHLQQDPWAQSLGVEYLELRRGYCRVALQLQPHMVNFQGTPHGGVIFSLADVAFSAACNSHGEPAVALTMTISYLARVPAGARLVAEAGQRRQGRRAGFYDVTVSGEDGGVVALVHCVAHRLGARGDPD